MATQTRTFIELPQGDAHSSNVTVTIPSTPADFVGEANANANTTAIDLSWTGIEGLLYTVYRSNVAIARELEAESYLDTGLEPDTSYTYQLRSLDPATGFSSLPATTTAATEAE